MTAATMRTLRLSDGLEVFCLNPDETRFVHGEVFGERCYLQHGIELRDGDCVFDVGANIGRMTQVLLELGNKVIAFEPQPDCIREIEARCGQYRQPLHTK